MARDGRRMLGMWVLSRWGKAAPAPILRDEKWPGTEEEWNV